MEFQVTAAGVATVGPCLFDVALLGADAWSLYVSKKSTFFPSFQK
jgi:hypothetical protein